MKKSLLSIGGILFLAAVLIANAATAQTMIKGTVKDENGLEIPHATIYVKNDTRGAYTDEKGSFSINLSPNDTLVVSSVGYQRKEIRVGNEPFLHIVLHSLAKNLNQLVVVGYGSQKKVNLTGAVASVGSEVFEDRPIASVSEALEGVVPNLNITTTSRGGELGNDRNWNIRGATTLSSGGAPLILVDNVPMDIMDVNPNDIKSVTVLKDAASSAIYGSRAAYGVILITTKNGRNDQKVSLRYSTNYSFSSPATLPHMASSIDFAKAWNYAYENSGRPPAFNDQQLGLIEQYMADPSSTPPNQRYPANDAKWNRWGAYTLSNANVDWFPVWFKKNALQQSHNLNISGGSNKTSYYLSGGYINQEGIMNFGDDNYKRYNINATVQTDVTDWLRFKLNTKYTNRERDYPNTQQESSNSKGSIYYNLARMWPTMPVYDPNGHFYDRNQILPLLEGGTKDTWNNYWVTLSGELEPVKDWTISIDYSWNNDNYKNFNHEPTIYGYNVDNTTFILTGNPNSISEQYSNTRYHTTNIYTSYEKTISHNYFKVMLGYQEELQNYSSLSGSTTDLITDEVPSISTSTGTNPQIDDEISHWSTQGFFGRLNYNFKEKYLAEINFRYDGSSRFEQGSRWGLFPSLSAGYRVSEEPFWENIKGIVNDFKLRGSFGTLGNSEVPNYLYVSVIPVQTNLPYYIDNGRPNYASTPGLISADLTWETSSTIDGGFDAQLFDKLAVTFDWYQRTTSRMFGPSEALPAVIGTTIPMSNNATLKTKGFELSLTWRDEIDNHFNYDVTFLLSNNTATVTRYNNPTKTLSTYYEGENLGEIWGYTSMGLFGSDKEAGEWIQKVDQSYLYSNWGAGDMRYKDINGDGKIDIGNNTADNPGDRSIIGNSTPHFAFGLKAGFNWRNITFSMFWQGVAKRDLALDGNMFYGFNGDEWSSSVLVQHLDYWRPDNTNAYYPKPYMSKEVFKNTQTQTKYLQNGAYMRLKNIQLGYNIPESIVQKIHLSKMNFYLSGENLVTVTKLAKMFDPEGIDGDRGDGNIYPITKAFSIGANITF